MGFVVLAWIVFGWVAGTIASGRGHSFANYFLCGVLLGPLGVIFAACVKRTSEAEAARLNHVEPVRAVPADASPPTANGLAKLADLHRSGALNDDEFSAAKRQLLGLAR